MLGTGQLSAIELEPVPFIEAAAAAGLDAVSLFLNPAGPKSSFPLTTGANVAAVRHALAGAGLRLMNIECFMLTPATRVDDFRASIERGAGLGASNLTALLYDADESRLRHNLASLHAIAAEAGLGVGIEFMGFTPRWASLAETVALIGSMHLPGLRVVIDCLHLVRTGGSVAEVAALAADRVSHVQLCDGSDLSPGAAYFEEAGVRRLVPGEGRFPIADLLRSVPSSVYLELEVPDPDRGAAPERLRRMAESTRGLIAAARSG